MGIECGELSLWLCLGLPGVCLYMYIVHCLKTKAVAAGQLGVVVSYTVPDEEAQIGQNSCRYFSSPFSSSFMYIHYRTQWERVALATSVCTRLTPGPWGSKCPYFC